MCVYVCVQPEPPTEDTSDGSDFLLRDDGNDLDLRMARLEHLMGRRQELLSSVILRQNPHNVAEVRVCACVCACAMYSSIRAKQPSTVHIGLSLLMQDAGGTVIAYVCVCVACVCVCVCVCVCCSGTSV